MSSKSEFRMMKSERNPNSKALKRQSEPLACPRLYLFIIRHSPESLANRSAAVSKTSRSMNKREIRARFDQCGFRGRALRLVFDTAALRSPKGAHFSQVAKDSGHSSFVI